MSGYSVLNAFDYSNVSLKLGIGNKFSRKEDTEEREFFIPAFTFPTDAKIKVFEGDSEHEFFSCVLPKEDILENATREILFTNLMLDVNKELFNSQVDINRIKDFASVVNGEIKPYRKYLSKIHDYSRYTDMKLEPMNGNGTKAKRPTGLGSISNFYNIGLALEEMFSVQGTLIDCDMLVRNNYSKNHSKLFKVASDYIESVKKNIPYYYAERKSTAKEAIDKDLERENNGCYTSISYILEKCPVIVPLVFSYKTFFSDVEKFKLLDKINLPDKGIILDQVEMMLSSVDKVENLDSLKVVLFAVMINYTVDKECISPCENHRYSVNMSYVSLGLHGCNYRVVHSLSD